MNIRVWNGINHETRKSLKEQGSSEFRLGPSWKMTGTIRGGGFHRRQDRHPLQKPRLQMNEDEKLTDPSSPCLSCHRSCLFSTVLLSWKEGDPLAVTPRDLQRRED